MPFEARLAIFEGPLDILVLLVRRGEIDPREVPVAEVVEQFLRYLVEVSPETIAEAGEFLALMSLLLEVKSQQLLPHPEEAPVEIEYRQQERLVERLLSYEQYRRAALLLEQRAHQWRQCFPRMAGEPEAPEPPKAAGLEQASLWDLFSAFQKVLLEAEASRPTSIIYDETPIHVYMDRILERIREKGRVNFRQLIPAGVTRAVLVNMLLAILELVVLGKIGVEQPKLFGEIWLVVRESWPSDSSPPSAEGQQELQATPESNTDA